MVRCISFWNIKPGADPEELHKYWREKHTAWAKDKLLPELRKYTINRVIHTFGETDIWGFSEVWFDDKESAVRAFSRLVEAEPDPMLANFITHPKRILVQVEEVEL